MGRVVTALPPPAYGSSARGALGRAVLGLAGWAAGAQGRGG